MNKTGGSFRRRKVNFTQVSNIALRDNNLSLKAKGLYALIMSYLTIEDWTLYKGYLMEQCSEGRESFNAGWNELKNRGYLLQYRVKDEKGKWTYEYDLLDNPDTENPYTENPLTENPYVYKYLLNNTNKTNTNNSNKERKNTNKEVKNNNAIYVVDEFEEIDNDILKEILNKRGLTLS